MKKLILVFLFLFPLIGLSNDDIVDYLRGKNKPCDSVESVENNSVDNINIISVVCKVENNYFFYKYVSEQLVTYYYLEGKI